MAVPILLTIVFRKMRRLLLLATFLVPHAVFAEALPDTLCAAGSDLERYLCYQQALKKRETEMQKELNYAGANTQSMWGAKAVQEMQQRLRETQELWLQYRDKQCHENYYTDAPVHPPSQSLAITMCQLLKTDERIQEIRNKR